MHKMRSFSGAGTEKQARARAPASYPATKGKLRGRPVRAKATPGRREKEPRCERRGWGQGRAAQALRESAGRRRRERRAVPWQRCATQATHAAEARASVKLEEAPRGAAMRNKARGAARSREEPREGARRRKRGKRGGNGQNSATK